MSCSLPQSLGPACNNVGATQSGTSTWSERPKDAVFVLILAEYVGKPHRLEGFVCDKPTAVYAIAMTRCSWPGQECYVVPATNGREQPCKLKLSSEGRQS